MITQPHFFHLANLFFSSLILLFIAIILVAVFFRITYDGKRQKWKLMADLLIRKTIFLEEDEEFQKASEIALTPRTVKHLKNPDFRKLLTTELTNARKNVSGSSADNLVRLYLQLNLHQNALANLKMGKWHIKALAIQELSIFGLKENLTRIYRYTNHSNDLLRMEAQVAIVRLSGFEGLRFLDLISYPLSEWQQIKLLHELAHVPPENFNGIEKWLKSENQTVIIFGLKLCRLYHRFELHDSVCACLVNEEPQVRLQAIYTLGKIYNEQTSGILIARLLKEELRHRMAIIKVLQDIGTNDDIPVLLDQLRCEDAALKQVAACALAKIGSEGLAGLLQHEHAKEYPLTEIIAQIKNEVVL